MTVRATAMVGLLAAGLLSGACCPSSCTPATLTFAPPSGAITMEAAIAAAKRQAPPATGDPTVGWAVVHPNPFASLGSSTQLVWEVSLLAPFAVATCPPGIFARSPLQSDP